MGAQDGGWRGRWQAAGLLLALWALLAVASFYLLAVPRQNRFDFYHCWVGARAVFPAVATLLTVPLLFIIDRMIQSVLNTAFGVSVQTSAPSSRQRLKLVLRYSLRALLMVSLFFWLMGLWGIDIRIGQTVAKGAFSIFIAIILSYVTWELINVPIQRKLHEQTSDEDGDREEGGSGGSRIGTLLLLQKFIFAVLIVMVVMIILSSLGVNIGPLIAGAGVIGLAIGFGAQTLVRDIIAGIFFLIDDAFRVGDYVDTGKVKGMVEHISLRSLRLRHHRGMVHTIPFGAIGSVTNYSRDYIIMKLDIRVRYDTDIDTVRKIIKKINDDLSSDPELGPKLIGKIKSQGIKEMDDSAMIMRIKYKTPPGEQFFIRREVYKRVQEAFKQKGIQFAYRNVTVYLPGETPEKGASEASDDKMIKAGAAAVAADANE